MTDDKQARDWCDKHQEARILVDCQHCRGEGAIEVEDDMDPTIVGFRKCAACNASGDDWVCWTCWEELQ